MTGHDRRRNKDGGLVEPATLDDIVAGLLGRRPEGRYTVVVSRTDGTPVVLANAPFLDSGRPMPTRYWLVDPGLNKSIGTLEAEGGVKRAEASVPPDQLAAVHQRYQQERNRLIPADHTGPRPTGGVGGTRVGVKCLHAHYAYFLAGGDDPVGRWVHQRLAEADRLDDDLMAAGAADEDPAPPDAASHREIDE